MGQTTIEWVRNKDGSQGHTVNPIRAKDKKTKRVGHFCERISPGCANCYASKLQSRFRMFPFEPKYRKRIAFFLDETKLFDVVRRQQPTTYFWEDMSDIFGDWVSDAWLDACFAVMAVTPQHTHMVLTKRAQRARDYFKTHAAGGKPIFALARKMKLPQAMKNLENHRWPLANVRIGVSIENQPTADLRVPFLLEIPAAERFISFEPALGPVTLKWAACSCPNKEEAFKTKMHTPKCALHPSRPGPLVHVVIIGGESGAGARAMYVQWVRSMIRQCNELGIHPFVKQLGAFPTETPIGTREFEKSPTRVIRMKLKSRKGTDMREWPADLQVREWP